MQKFWHLLLFLTSFYALKAQEPKGTGKNTVLKIRTSYNATVEKLLPTGHWTYLNADGEMCKEGDYKVEGEKSYQHGVWSFYNTDGVAFVKITYSKDIPQQIEILDSGSNRCGKSTLQIELDTADVYHVKCFECKDILKFTVPKVPFKVNFSELKPEGYSTETKIEKAGGLVVYPIPPISSGTGVFTGNTTIIGDSVWIGKYPWIPKSTVPGLDIKNKNNLVLNSGFDRAFKHKKIPDDATLGKHIFPYWFMALESPDAFARDKESYAGFRVADLNYEILGSQLSQPLESGVKYCFQMQIRLRETNHNATTNAGVILSPEPLKLNKFSNNDFMNHPPVVLSADSLYLCQREHWQTISGSFTASGDEKYLYIGVFPPNRVLNILQLDPLDTNDRSPGKWEIYYYVDNVILLPSDSSIKCLCTSSECPLVEDTITTKDTVIIPKQFVFKNIQFETNKSTLLQTAFTSLDSVMVLLEDNPKMRLKITGHTDNEGDDEANQILSEERAKTVYDFLIENGIDATRLEYEGKGESEPVDSNKTARGRANNRRVTFTVLE